MRYYLRQRAAFYPTGAVMHLRQYACFLILGSTALAFVGCASAQTPACDIPERGNLLIEATDRLNPDDNGQPLPTIVRIYQLSGLGSLELASFEEIWQEAEDTLGDTLLVADEVTVYPGQTLRRTFERDPAANYIVGVAIVRRPAGLSWRTILELPISAEAQRCAAMQQDPEEPPSQPDVSRIALRVDMYTIEGSMALDSGSGRCPAGDLECVRNRVEQAEVPDLDQSEAPEVDTPSSNSAPSTPTMPSMKEKH